MRIDKIKNRNVVFVHKIPEWDLNIHLIMGDRYNYVIDTGLGAFSVAPVQEYLKDNGNPIVVINTHHHWDHIWGNQAFDGCMIVSHRLCREIIAVKWDVMLERNKQYIREDIRMCLPNVVFEDTLYFAEDRVRLFHSPGHSIDCISVYDEEDGVINVGDNIGFADIYPDIKTGSAIFARTLLEYKRLDFDTCVAGHKLIRGKGIIDTLLVEYA